MTENPIHDLDGLMTAFGVTSIADLEWAIEEAADIDDGRTVFIDDGGPGVSLGIGTRGLDVNFPTSVHAVLELAAEVEQMQEDEPFRIIPGEAHSPVIIHVPHSSRMIPDEVRADISLDDAALERELNAMTDTLTDVIAERTADLADVRPWLFVNGLSRLVVDPERFPDEREEMNAVGMGAVYTRTSDGFVLRDPSDDEISGLVDQYFSPYAAALSDLVDDRLSAVGEVTIIDLHSYPLDSLPYELHAEGPRPEVCIGTDRFHTSDELTTAVSEAFEAYEVGLDSPFAGCYVPLKHHAADRRVSAFMIELRRDVYLDESLQPVDPAIDRIAERLAMLCTPVLLAPKTTCGGIGSVMDAPTTKDEQ